MVVHRVLDAPLAEPRVRARRRRRRELEPGTRRAERSNVLHLGHGGGGGGAPRGIRLALRCMSPDRILQDLYPLNLLVGREARAFELLDLREFPLERFHARFFKRLLARRLALRLVPRHLLLALLAAVRVAGGQSLRAFGIGGRTGERGRETLRGARGREEAVEDPFGRGVRSRCPVLRAYLAHRACPRPETQRTKLRRRRRLRATPTATPRAAGMCGRKDLVRAHDNRFSPPGRV